MRARRINRAFSLLEVAIAIALAGGTVALMLGMLSPLGRSAADSLDAQVALRLTDSIRVELERSTGGDLAARAAAIPAMTADPADGLQFVANRDGTVLRRLDGGASPVLDQHFLVCIRRFATGPLAYDGTVPVLAVNVVVAWPYRRLTADGLAPPTNPAVRQTATFNVSVTR
jgi:hypothetical protein